MELCGSMIMRRDYPYITYSDNMSINYVKLRQNKEINIDSEL